MPTSADSDTDWRSLILGLLGRAHDLPQPSCDGMMRCDPVVPYGGPVNRETWKLLDPVWPVSGGLFSVKGVLVTGEELDQLYECPPEVFRMNQWPRPSSGDHR